MAQVQALERNKRYAVIRVRGVNNTRKTINATCKLMNIAKIHNLSFIDDRISYRGMLQKAKDTITWGEVNVEMVEQVLSKWGRLPGNKVLTDAYMKEKTKFATIKDFAKAFVDFKAELKDVPELKPWFRLHPPRKGYEATKLPYSIGGSLGYRGESINQLIKKMT